MLVRATKKGYYGLVLREEGDEFEITDPKHFADHYADHGLGWMVKVEAVEPSSKGASESGPVGARPAPVSDDVRRQRIAQAEKLAKDSEKKDKSVI